MKYLAIFAEGCALLWLGAAMYRFPARSLPVSVWIFFGVQFVYAATAFIGLQKQSTSGAGYAAFYGLTLTATVLSACLLTGWLHRATPLTLQIFLACGALILPCAFVSLAYARLLEIYAKHGKAVPDQSLFALFQFAALGFLACMAAGAWLTEQTEIERTLTLGLGAYWLALAVFTLAYIVEAVRGKEQWSAWQGRNAWVPALIGLVAFAWLAFRFTTLQVELSRAHGMEMTEEVAAAQQEQVFERSGR